MYMSWAQAHKEGSDKTESIRGTPGSLGGHSISAHGNVHVLGAQDWVKTSEYSFTWKLKSNGQALHPD